MTPLPFPLPFPFLALDDPRALRREVAGGKAAMLARMLALGLPVPPGVLFPAGAAWDGAAQAALARCQASFASARAAHYAKAVGLPGPVPLLSWDLIRTLCVRARQGLPVVCTAGGGWGGARAGAFLDEIPLRCNGCWSKVLSLLVQRLGWGRILSLLRPHIFVSLARLRVMVSTALENRIWRRSSGLCAYEQ